MRETSKPGFTTIEVLIAIAIIGFLLTPLLVMQTSSLETVARFSSSLDRIFLAQSFLHQARRVTSQQSSQNTGSGASPNSQSSQQSSQSVGSPSSPNSQTAQQSGQDQRFSFSAEELDPVTHLIYERSPVPKNSSLAHIPGLMLEKIDAIGAQSRVGMRKPVERLVSFMYVPIQYIEREKA
jgi:prepilin-type N-terminal cleavage/methylation domain-containing protein